MEEQRQLEESRLEREEELYSLHEQHKADIDAQRLELEQQREQLQREQAQRELELEQARRQLEEERQRSKSSKTKCLLFNVCHWLAP